MHRCRRKIQTWKMVLKRYIKTIIKTMKKVTFLRVRSRVRALRI